MKQHYKPPAAISSYLLLLRHSSAFSFNPLQSLSNLHQIVFYAQQKQTLTSGPALRGCNIIFLKGPSDQKKQLCLEKHWQAAQIYPSGFFHCEVSELISSGKLLVPHHYHALCKAAECRAPIQCPIQHREGHEGFPGVSILSGASGPMSNTESVFCQRRQRLRGRGKRERGESAGLPL